MQRFYIPHFKKRDEFLLNDKDAPRTFPTGHIFHQLVKVLRVRKLEKIILFNWIDNLDLVFQITEINKKNIKLKFIEEVEKKTELNFELNLYQALPNKLEKIEYILQKWVEVWFRKFVFYRSERSQKLIISDKKEERLKKIIIEAVEQSWRSFVPEFDLTSNSSPLEERGKNVDIFLHTKNNNSQNLSQFINIFSTKGFSPLQNINIYIWPEWGFSEKEIEYFEKNNFSRIHLWNRILRTETAWVVVGFTLWQII